MPNNPVHIFWSRRATGRECARTHRIIDSFSSTKGKAHRELFHDPMSAALVATVVEGPRCVAAAQNHLLIDRLYGDPNTKIVMEMVRLRETSRPERGSLPSTQTEGRGVKR